MQYCELGSRSRDESGMVSLGTRTSFSSALEPRCGRAGHRVLQRSVCFLLGDMARKGRARGCGGRLPLCTGLLLALSLPAGDRIARACCAAPLEVGTGQQELS